jgi:epoxyqueuosine reductase
MRRCAVNPSDKRQCVGALIEAQGFERWGIAGAEPIERADYVRQWLAAGRAGSMAYLHRHFAQRTDARQLLPGARSVIVGALNYHQPRPHRPAGGGPRGRVAMYAWGDDYHRVIKRKLFAVVDGLREQIDEAFDAKVCVDTAPLLEREYAVRAGVGWIGKNTLVMDAELGSYFFLGAIVTTLDLPYDQPVSDHCGSCTRCLEACPTQAFPRAYEMDASRCISYLTIEHRAPRLPEELQPAIGDWVFGCDICQEVCPHNRDAPVTAEPRFAVRPPGALPVLNDLLQWTDAEYAEVLRASAIKRAKPAMLRRNAQVAQANAKRARSEPRP